MAVPELGSCIHSNSRALRAILIGLLLSSGANLHAQLELEVVHSFESLPLSFNSGITVGSNGHLYANASGRIVRVEESGKLTTLHAFNPPDGSFPGDLVAGEDGTLYGTMQAGGPLGCGTVFRARPDGQFETLHAFGTIHGHPRRFLTRTSRGTFLGAAAARSGFQRINTIFEIEPSGSYQTLHTFSEEEFLALQPILEASDGALIGATVLGGAHEGGFIYRRRADGNVTRPFDFGAPGAGRSPQGRLVERPSGVIYGVTREGGESDLGTVYALRPDGEVTFLHSFSGPDGASPRTGLVEARDGCLYGTTHMGGDAESGTIFRITDDDEFETVLSFMPDGTHRLTSPLVEIAPERLLGTSGGWLFEVTPAGALNIRLDLRDLVARDGWRPASPMLEARDGSLYSVTRNGGPGGRNTGTVFKISPEEGFVSLHGFSGPDGRSPRGLIESREGKLIGVTRFGGVAGLGTIYEITPEGALTLLHEFTSGGEPRRALVEGPDGRFYGTYSGDRDGGIYRFDRVEGVRRLHRFVSGVVPKGVPFFLEFNPYASLVVGRSGRLYGTTMRVEASRALGWCSTAFEITTAGEYSHWAGLRVEQGCGPFGSLVELEDGSWLGTGSFGGRRVGGLGAIFRLDPSGEVETVHAFSGKDGATPAGGLLLARDGHVYGTTLEGGTHDRGTVFRVEAARVFRQLHSFSGVDGAEPWARLTEVSDGFVYGTARTDGPLAGGVVFRFRPPGDLPPPFLRGDCNRDDVVDVFDAVRLLSFLFLDGTRPGCLDACDADDDGRINISDALVTTLVTVGGLTAGGAERLTCGFDDLTPDSLDCEEWSHCR